MVAKAGRGWNLAPSLIAMVNEANKIAPKRSQASDGSIGDQAHKQRNSDHNPSGGYVHGVDITHDPKNGMDIHAHARNIAARMDPRIEYIISNGMIWERETKKWKKYTGTNPHNKHAHFSVRHTYLARFDTSYWFKAVIAFPSPVITPPPVVAKPTPAPVPQPVPQPIPTPEPLPVPPLTEEEDEMKLFRDHNGAVWLWGTDGSRRHLDTQGKVDVWQKNMGLQLIDLGPGSAFFNPIVSQVWLDSTFPR